MIVAGFGFREGASLSSLRAALAAAQEGHGPVARLATARSKLDGLRALADELGVPLVGLEPAVLAAAETMTRSPASMAAYGTGSVAEASALVAAGSGARLLGLRQISPDRMATCAIAQGSTA